MRDVSRGLAGVLCLATLALAGVRPLSAQNADRRDDEVPSAQRPPAGMCRIWIDGVPADRQPAPTDCASAIRRRPSNARVVFGTTGSPERQLAPRDESPSDRTRPPVTTPDRPPAERTMERTADRPPAERSADRPPPPERPAERSSDRPPPSERPVERAAEHPPAPPAERPDRAARPPSEPAKQPSRTEQRPAHPPQHEHPQRPPQH